MKLHAISDLHVAFKENFLALGELPDHPDDWLVLCGDIADTPKQLEIAFQILQRKFAKLIWVPWQSRTLVASTRIRIARRGTLRRISRALPKVRTS